MFVQNGMLELSSRQRQILVLLRKGLSNNEICSKLGITENTVKVHLRNIYKILNVSNRIEALNAANTLDITEDDSPKELSVIFHKVSDISDCPKAYSLYLSLVEAIQQYRIFRILECGKKNDKPGLIIDVSASKDEDEMLFVTTRIGSSDEILWTTSIKANSDNITSLAQKSAMQLFRSLVIASAKLNYIPDSPLPYWWFVTTRCIAGLESRSQESFEICKEKLTPFVVDSSYNEFTIYVLAYAYYIAILENWGNPQLHAKELANLARKAMVKTPCSIYTQMIMALYNIASGNKSEALAYLKHVVEANPQSITARMILIQIYMLTNHEDEALKLLDECTRLIPEMAMQASINHARTFILLLQGKYEECRALAKQVLLFTPKALTVRLCLILSDNMLGDLADSRIQVKKFFEYNPKYGKKDLEQLLKGVSEEKKAFFMARLKNIFY